jgi:hypothetical protein
MKYFLAIAVCFGCGPETACEKKHQAEIHFTYDIQECEAESCFSYFKESLQHLREACDKEKK